MEQDKITDEVIETISSSVSGKSNEVSTLGAWMLFGFTLIGMILSGASAILIKSGLTVYLGEGFLEFWIMWCISILPIIGLLLFKPVWSNQVGGSNFLISLFKLLSILSWFLAVLFISTHLILTPGQEIQASDIKIIINGSEVSFNSYRAAILIGISALITIAPLLVSDRIFPNVKD